MKGNKYRTLLWSVVGGLFCICFFGFLFVTPYISSGNDSDTTTAENSDRNVKFNKEDGYMEDKSSDENKKNIQEQFFDIDFSDVKEEQKEMSKEDIIAAAEAAAFQEDNNK